MARSRLVSEPRVTSNPPSPLPSSFSIAAWFVLGLTLSACQATTAPQQVVPTSASTNSSPIETRRVDPLAEGTSFKTIHSDRFGFSLELPDAGSFEIKDQKEPWFTAFHPLTGSTVLVRSWREYEMMNRVSCEQRARLYRDLPTREHGTVIEDRRVDVPPDHDTMVEVRVREKPESPRFIGSMLAFGGWSRHCFAFVFATTDDDETIVAARLSTIVHATLERMKFDNGLTPKRTPPDLKTPLRLDPLAPTLP